MKARHLANVLSLTLLFAASSLIPLDSSFAAPPKSKKGAKSSAKKDGKKKRRPALGFRAAPGDLSHFEIDPAAEGNEVTFTSVAPKEKIVGTAGQVTGTLDAKPKSLKDAKGKFTVAWSALDTGKPGMNQHMRAAPWVDASAFPEIVFTLEGIEKMKTVDKRGTKLKATLVGAFALNGAERKMRIPATLQYVLPAKDGAAPKTNGEDAPTEGEEVKEGIRINASFSLGLKDFNIVGKGVGQAVAATQKIKVALFLPKAAAEETEPPKPPEPPKPKGRTRFRPSR
ncbi:MAG TPA: YceI family protein [Phycisphaerae bacterium]|nr:YceI family protein [Phycisphaerae bacterium]